MMHPRRSLVLLLVLLVGSALAQQEGGTSDAFENLELELVAEGFVSPVSLAVPEGDDRLFVVDRPGQVYEISADGERAEEPFLDISDRVVELNPQYDERGLLGFAFHPDYAENGRVYAYYSAPLRGDAPEGWNHTAVLSEFTRADDGGGIDPNSERVLLEVDEPQMNHDGGQLLFGHDGYLYLGLGDGGGADDTGEGHPPLGNGQDVTTLLGSILRIDVDAESGYGIPDDNPFADGADLPEDLEWAGDEARPEIYLWGLRNPYRFSVDRETGDLLVADVGQNVWEEVNLVTEPGNLGWNLAEGSHPFDPENPSQITREEGPETGPLGNELVDPILEYLHSNLDAEEGRGISVTGGYLYRGEAIPELQGHYVFGDWSRSGASGGRMFVAAPPQEEGGQWSFAMDRGLDEFLLALGEDASGELYFLTSESAGSEGETGKVYRLVPGSGSSE